MKQILLSIMLSGTIFSEIPSELSEKSAEIVKLLDIGSTLNDKASGISYAMHYDNEKINDTLVSLLDDRTRGGRISTDEAIEMPWIEAMHLLAKRFPEAKIKVNIDYKYTQIDKENFQKWWSQNRKRIKYQDNQHILVGDESSATSTDDSPRSSVIHSSKNQEIEVSSVQTEAVKQPASTTITKSPVSTPKNKKQKSSTPWVVTFGLIGAAIGVLFFLLKRR
jgi:hypothetical protein